MSIYARNARQVVVLSGLVALMAATTAQPCTTPVYRYAMYNWATSPYVVFYFHRGEPAEEDAGVNQVLAKLSRELPAANVVYEPVNLDAENPLEGYPEPIKTAHAAHAEQEGPFHLVMTPWLAELHAGRLNGNDVQAMIESPARTRMGELLDEGNAALLVLVRGKDDAENQRARVVKQLIDQAGSGELLPGMLPEVFPPDPPMPAQAAEGDPSDEPADPAADDKSEPAAGLQLAMLEVSRSEPAETWLIRSLMAVEPDLEEYADEPMVFAVYGRGRAMPPYIGEGVTVDLLADVVAFLVGPCSCMVKEQNPGMDLLVRWDWEATADKMAANDPTLTDGFYNPYMYQELEVGEAESQASEAETASDDALAELAAVTTDLEMPAEDTAPVEDAPAAAAVEIEPAQPEAEPEPDADTVGAAESSSQSPAAVPAGAPSQDVSGGFTSRMLWRLGLGVVVGAVVVLGVGFVLVRKQG